MLNKKWSALLVICAACGTALAQNTTTDSQGITTSTDPARVAAVEQHAQELSAQQSKTGMSSDKASMHQRPMHHKTPMRHGKHHRPAAAAQPS